MTYRTARGRFYGAAPLSRLFTKAMASTMNEDQGIFTATDFRARAERRGLPLSVAGERSDRVEASRGDHELDPGAGRPDGNAVSLRPASVLIGVVDREPGATVILTMRASHLSSHAGQIAFPGGRAEAGDSSLIETALREAHEEIGLAPDCVTPLGLLEPYETRSGYRIMPVLGVVTEKMALRPDEQEVAEIFEVPLSFLMTAANHQRHSAFWKGRQRHFYAMPYGERYIWGATAGILRIMYERLYAE